MAHGNQFEVSVRGYRELLRALKEAPPDTRRQVRAAFREVGESVRVKAAELFQKYSSVSAAGYKVRVRRRGIAVEQSIRKTSGARPDYGALQMKEALLPARRDTYARTQVEFEHALDEVVRHFNGL